MTMGSGRRSRRWATAAVCAGTLVVAGCGSAGEPATTAASTTASTTASTPVSAAGSGEVTITDTWVKASVGAQDPTMTAAFGVLTNHTGQDLTVVSASNDVTDRTELHEMAMVDGAMVMRPIAGGIKIPANGTTTLEPGGLHVMIMDVTTPITPGDDVHVTLTLNDGSSMTFAALAKDFAGANEQYNGSAASSAAGSAAMDMGTGSMDMGAGSMNMDMGTSGTSNGAGATPTDG